MKAVLISYLMKCELFSFSTQWNVSCSHSYTTFTYCSSEYTASKVSVSSTVHLTHAVVLSGICTSSTETEPEVGDSDTALGLCVARCKSTSSVSMKKNYYK